MLVNIAKINKILHLFTYKYILDIKEKLWTYTHYYYYINELTVKFRVRIYNLLLRVKCIDWVDY